MQAAILTGKDFQVSVSWRNRFGREMRYTSGFEGVMPYIERKFAEAESDSQRQRFQGYLREVPCPVCEGTRLKPEVLAVTVNGRSIADVTDMSLDNAYSFMDTLTLTDREAHIAAAVLREIRRTPRVPARGRPELPDARARCRRALRRRGAAHPTGDADRLRV